LVWKITLRGIPFRLKVMISERLVVVGKEVVLLIREMWKRVESQGVKIWLRSAIIQGKNPLINSHTWGGNKYGLKFDTFILPLTCEQLTQSG
jgi:hypothetical protein